MKNILLIEDRHTKYFKELIEKEIKNVKVTEAKSFSEYETVVDQQKEWDAAVVDLQLPDDKGNAHTNTGRLILQNLWPRIGHSKIIVITSFLDDVSVREYLDQLNLYSNSLEKPIHDSEFVKLVKKALLS